MTNCRFNGEVTATKSTDNYAGGIAGYGNTSNVSNCYNIGTVSASIGINNYAGGITGYGFDSTTVNCYNIGAVNASSGTYSNYAGGIAGDGSQGTVSNCYWLDSISTPGFGGTTDNSLNCSSFTAGQGRGTSKDFTYVIGNTTNTGTLLDALNEWVGLNNGGTPDFLHWS